MEFRAQDQDTMRSATSATSSLGFTHQPSPADRRRSLVSAAAHNGNNKSATPSSCTNAQTLEQPRAVQKAVQLHSNKYRECLKNHAASVGGSVFDGCGEFMPSGEDGSLEALKCAACACHRNFHRKEVDGGGAGQLAIYSPGTRRSSSSRLQITPPAALLHYPPPFHHKFPIVQPMNVAYAGGATESSSEELNATADNNSAPPYSKKRFRTKFTQDQKDRMLEFAERVGWRFQKQDAELVERFCSEVGVRRQVLKVWMHNNKSNNLKTNHQLDHVSILMGNLANTATTATTTATTTAATAATTTDATMNQQLSHDAAVDDDDHDDEG